MTPEQAIEVLHQVAEQTVTNGPNHTIMREAIQTLRDQCKIGSVDTPTPEIGSD